MIFLGLCGLLRGFVGGLLRFCWDLWGVAHLWDLGVFFDFDRHVLMLKCLGLPWFGPFLDFCWIFVRFVQVCVGVV